ncbi:hypothetical protein TNCV_521361 [Trichonephila clavipes]|nr:hypothetical protein TNCV_521361 [Trichonephila clavipes]
MKMMIEKWVTFNESLGSTALIRHSREGAGTAVISEPTRGGYEEGSETTRRSEDLRLLKQEKQPGTGCEGTSCLMLEGE